MARKSQEKTRQETVDAVAERLKAITAELCGVPCPECGQCTLEFASTYRSGVYIVCRGLSPRPTSQDEVNCGYIQSEILTPIADLPAVIFTETPEVKRDA